jgi:hypothetical protein
MVKPAGLVMAVVMLGVAAGTYFGLDRVPREMLPARMTGAVEPPAKEQRKSALQQAAAPTPVTPAAPAPAEQPLTEQDLAEEPPPPEEPAAVAAEPETAPEPEAASATEAEPAPAPAPKPAPVAKSKPAPKPAPPPAPEAEEEASESTTVASAAPASPEPAPGPVKPSPPEADLIKPWWPAPEKMPENQLKLHYAGQVQGEEAIALLFSGAVQVGTLAQHAQIMSFDGRPVPGEWELGKNPRLAVFRVGKPGRYTVILQPQVADAQGFMLGTTLQGPVYIRQP